MSKHRSHHCSSRHAHQKPVRGAAALTAFALFSLVNPGYFAGCASSYPEEPDFGEAEMLQVLESANTMSWAFESAGTRYRLDLDLKQKDGEDMLGARQSPEPLWGNPAHACGSRTFLNSASACLTTTTLPVNGTLSLHTETDAGEQALLVDQYVHGGLIAGGTSLQGARLELVFQDGSELTLSTEDTQLFTVDYFVADALGDAGLHIMYPAQ